MDLIFDDEFDAPNEIPKVPIKKNPDLNNSKNTLEFLSKEHRERLHKSEEQKAQDQKKQKELQSVEHKKIYLSLRGKDRRKDNYERRKRSRSREKDFEKKRTSSNDTKEIEAIKVKYHLIKSYYLGANKEKKKLIKPSEKFKNIFNFEWDPCEDTSNDINPLYSKRLEPQLLFGRGFKAGIDIKEQKRQSQTYTELLLKRDMIENDKESKDKKSERIKDKNDGKFSWSEKIRGLGEDNIHWSKKKLPEMTERDWRIFREDQDIIIKGGRVPNPLRGWDEGNLPGFILNAIKTAGYKMPTSIQMQGIPIGLEKRDMIGLAPTGSGKSAAFLIPLIVYLSNLPPLTEDNAQDGPYAMILAPSRELALQIFEEFNKFSKNSKLRAVCVVGGAFILRKGVEIIIGTPGRIKDSLDRQYTSLNQCHYIVLDEADKMINEGFEEHLNYILDCIPDNNMKSEDEKTAEMQEIQCKLGQKKFRITMMFSATMTAQLEKLARKYLRCPSYISIGEPGIGKKEIVQKIEFLQENQKKERLRNILEKFSPPIMIFVNQKKAADLLCKSLEKSGYKAATLHGGKSQESREKALNGFKEGKYEILVCTNLAARGIDVEGVTLVINFDAPKGIEDYNHRIGRTGRAGKKGIAITFLTNSDEEIFYDLKEYLEINEQHVPPELANHPASKIKPGLVQDNVPRRKQILYAA